jgi:hypothetical protein
VVVLNYRPDRLPSGVSLLAEFTHSIVKDERFYLFHVPPAGTDVPYQAAVALRRDRAPSATRRLQD